MPKKHHRLGTAVVVGLLIIASILAGLQFVPVSSKTQINFNLIGVQTCSPWPICQYTTSASTTGIASSTVTGSGQISSGTIAETWQHWTVHYTDGSTKSFDGSQHQMIQFQAMQSNAAPAWLDVVVPLVLDVQLHYHADPWPIGTEWHEEARVLSYTSAIVDGIQVGQRLTLTPIVFTNDDPIGTEHDYTVRVIFNGSPGPASGPYSQTIDATGSLNGKTSAAFVLSFHQVWSQWVVYTAAPIITGAFYNLSPCPAVYGYVSLPYGCQVGPSRAFDPPGSIQFQWSTGACVGGCTVTAPTIHLVTCPADQGGTGALCVSQASVSTVITTKQLSITIIANATVVSVLPNGNLNGTSGTGPMGGNCKLGSGVFTIPLPDWVCEKTLGINNVVLALIIIVGLIVLVVVLAVIGRIIRFVKGK